MQIRKYYNYSSTTFWDISTKKSASLIRAMQHFQRKDIETFVSSSSKYYLILKYYLNTVFPLIYSNFEALNCIIYWSGTYFKIIKIIHTKFQNLVIALFQITVNNYNHDIQWNIFQNYQLFKLFCRLCFCIYVS